MQAAADFAVAQGGTAVIEELPSYLAFFSKYVPNAEAVRLPFSPTLPPSTGSLTGAQSVGTEITLGTRLISTSLFDNEQGRATLLETVTNVLSFTTPYIVVGTPFLYNYTAGTTSVTPAWYDSLWHVCSPRLSGSGSFADMRRLLAVRAWELGVE